MRLFLTFIALVAICLAAILTLGQDQQLPVDSPAPTGDTSDGQPPGDDHDLGSAPAIDAPAERDPRHVLIDLIDVSQRGPDLQAVYDHLAERFQILEYDEEWVDVIDPRRRLGFIDSLDQLEIEEYEGYTLLRSTENWMATWVFVVEDGEWRYDPGDRFLLMASAHIRQSDQDRVFYGMAAPQDYVAMSQSEPHDGSITPLVRGRLFGVGVHEEGVDVTMVWEYEFGGSSPDDPPVQSHLLEDVVIPLDSITWEAGDASGGVEVRWTDGDLTSEELRLMGWPDAEVAGEATADRDTYRLLSYGATIRLMGVPAHAEEILLRFDSVQVGPFGDDGPVPPGESITYSWEFTFPAESTDPVLTGEPPATEQSDDPRAEETQ